MEVFFTIASENATRIYFNPDSHSYIHLIAKLVGSDLLFVALLAWWLRRETAEGKFFEAVILAIR